MIIPAHSNPIVAVNKDYRMISKRSTSELCERNTFCGLAYYNARYAITSYRKNNRCNCDDEYSCVLTDNLSDRQAYVFKCRTRAQSENMYLFPE